MYYNKYWLTLRIRIEIDNLRYKQVLIFVISIPVFIQSFSTTVCNDMVLGMLNVIIIRHILLNKYKVSLPRCYVLLDHKVTNEILLSAPLKTKSVTILDWTYQIPLKVAFSLENNQDVINYSSLYLN